MFTRRVGSIVCCFLISGAQAGLAQLNIAAEGAVQASSTFSVSFEANLAVDGDRTTSWFSAGSNADGDTSTFRWTGSRDDLITSVAVLSNAQHPQFPTGFGFNSITVQILNAANSIVFAQTVGLPGTPDPDVIVQPNVVGRSVVLLLIGHEDPTCGGFSELQVFADRAAAPSVDPLSLDFGAVAIGSSVDSTIIVTNTGGNALNIFGVTLKSEIDEEPFSGFSIVSGGDAGILAPLESRSIRVRFSPQEEGIATDFLFINTDAASSPDTVSLSGAGLSANSLADAPWPKFHHDNQNTGRTTAVGPEQPALKWAFDAGGTPIFSSPAIGADGTIYVGTGSLTDGKLFAINSDGTPKWTFTTSGRITNSSPAIAADGTIYIGALDSTLHAVQADGTLKWAFKTGFFIHSSPAIGTDGTIYVGSLDRNLYAINPDGSLKWSFTTGNSISESSPAIADDGTVYVVSADFNLYAIASDGVLKWKFQGVNLLTATPALGADGTIYVGAGVGTVPGRLYAVNPDGTLQWEFMTGAGGIQESSPAIGADATIYVASLDSNLYAINSDGTLKWALKTGGQIYSSPAIDANGTIYVGVRDANLYAVDSNGTLKWTFKTGNFIDSSPALGSDGTIYVGSADSKLYAIGAAAQTTTFTRITTGEIANDGGSSYTSNWGDYDNDGDADLFVANTNGENNFLYRNNGDGTFLKITTGDIVNDGGNSVASSWGDFDNDGDLDLFVANAGGENNFLYRNNGDGTFFKITDGVIVNDGGNSQGCSWGDFENDGNLDLFVTNAGENNFLYANNGDGTFAKITQGIIVNDVGNSFGCSWADYDNDGDLDLFVANAGENNFLYSNNSDGSFTKITAGDVVNDGDNSIGGSWGDYDNDGDLDLFVTNAINSGAGFPIGNNFLYTNNGDGTFTKITTGDIVLEGGDSIGSAWGDFDNDGDLDLFVANATVGGIGTPDPGPNFLYDNNGDGTFTKIVIGPVVTDLSFSLGGSWADVDNDGDLDLFVANGGQNNFLYANDGNSNNRIDIKCAGTVSNTSAIGAKVRVKATINGRPTWQLTEISGQTGSAGQNSLNAEFGLGNATVIDSIRVEWPSGIVQVLTSIAVNQFLVINEISGQVSLSPPALDFGAVAVGANAEQTVTVNNTGAANLNITGTTLTGANAGEFAIVSGGGASTVPPAGSRQITVRFTPQSAASKTAALTIASNAPTSPDAVNLSGSGVLVISPPTTSTPTEGQNLAVTVTPPPGFQPTTQQMFFRQAGQTDYQVTTMAPAGANLIGTIPSSFVTLRGVEYYISLSDGQTVALFPENDPVNNPAVIAVQVDQFEFPLAVQAQIFRMISVPLSLNNSQIDSVLADDYGDYSAVPQQWRLFRWQGNDYAEHPNISTGFTPGAGFWLITRQGNPFTAQNAQSVNSAQAITITLEPNNWTQIANPFAFPVAWDSVLAASGQVASQQVQAPVIWNGTDYEYNQTTLQPWEGYFVFNLSASSVQLSVPPRESQGALVQMTDRSLNENLIRALSRSERPVSGSDLLQLSENEFIVQIKAQGLQSGWKDGQNFVGMFANATDALDRFDFLEAPPIGNYIRLSIVEQNHIYAGNFRALSEAGGVWDLQLSTTGQKENVRLTFAESQKLPNGFEIWLLDTDRQRALPLKAGQTEIDIAAKGAATNLRLIVGTPEFANASNEGIPLVPYQFTLHQNYPNPFNPETKIDYELAERSEVRLDIYNILGQKVRTLVNAAQSAGRYSVQWDGRDHNGNAVASAVYVYRLEAGEFVAVRKLVLSR